jgi:hypothetical protein
MYNLNIVKKQYIVLQIRLNDECFENNLNSLTKKIVDKLTHFIQVILNGCENIDVFLSCSNNEAKKLILQYKFIPNCKTLFFDITHTAFVKEDVGFTDDPIINTLKDFYIMSHSKKIYSCSVYEHGSGFSKWCALTYDIPYVSYFLSN